MRSLVCAGRNVRCSAHVRLGVGCCFATGALNGSLAQRQSVVSPAPSNAQINRALTQQTGYSESQVADQSVCSNPAHPGGVRCTAQVLVTRSGHQIIHPAPGPPRQPEPTATSAQPQLPAPTSNGLRQPTPWTPAYLQEAYDLSWLSANRGTGDTVAIVDAGYDDTAAADLATFRTQNGLAACPTTGVDPCFRQVNEYGSSDASQMPGTLAPGF